MKKLTGAASFYIVAFSTLILVIIATSFATVILSEVTRSMNDDLSQSAYDAALAGIEDAKLAYANYQRCYNAELARINARAEGATLTPSSLSSESSVTCRDILYWMNNPDCDMVGHILGRIPKTGEESSGEVLVSDTVSVSGEGVENNLNQAYTCVKINTSLSDYRASLSSSSQMRVVKAEFQNVAAEEIRAIKFSWYEKRDGEQNFTYNALMQVGAAWQATFRPITSAAVATPPVVELRLVQTSQNFTFNQVISATTSGATDRATLYLVPSNNQNAALKPASGKTDNGSYIGVEQGDVAGEANNVISASQVAKTNDQTIRNLPFGVWCPENGSGDFLCSVTVNLPEPIGSGERNDDTFLFVATLPYGQPDTDFSMEFICENDPCRSNTAGVTHTSNIATIKGAQVEIDSTGRANDLFRRVEVRLESADVSFPYVYYAAELLDPAGGDTLNKTLTVTSEYNFYK